MRKRSIFFCISLSVCLTMLMPALVFSVAKGAGLKMPEYSVTGGWLLHDKDTPMYEQNAKEFKLEKAIAKPKIISWKGAQEFFDFSKTLPNPSPKELTYTLGVFSKKTVQTQHLPVVFEKVYDKNFSDSQYGLKNPPVAGEDWLRSFGNIMEHFKAFRGKAKETQEALGQLKKYPKIWSDLELVLPQLVEDDFLYSPVWTPWKDGSERDKENDGILFLPYWLIGKDASRGPYWNQNLGDHKVYQGGVFMYSSLKAIKKVERDYGRYPRHVGMGYLLVAPVGGSFIAGLDAKGDEFTGIQILVRQDIPIYDPTKYIMKLLDYYNPKGYYISDYYSQNRDSLNWMAGRDTFFNVKNTQGKFVGWLIATELDYDIKGLPERDKDRIVSIKGAWGNIKLISEGFEGLSKMGSGPGTIED